MKVKTRSVEIENSVGGFMDIELDHHDGYLTIIVDNKNGYSIESQTELDVIYEELSKLLKEVKGLK